MDNLNPLVVGAGTMGVEIALTFAMVGQDVWLLDLPGVSQASILRAEQKYAHDRHRFAALGMIKTGDILNNLERARDRRWVIEAVPESLELKVEIISKLTPYLDPKAVITTNTSGISITTLRSLLPELWRPRFFGTHFFNPASQNRLVELIPADMEDNHSYIGIRTNLLRMGKVCVESLDQPNFIVNHFAFSFVMKAIEQALSLGLSVQQVDALSGKAIGRPRTATYGLLDLIGLDVWLAICKNMGSETEEFPEAMRLIQKMVSNGYFGRKTGSGFYKYQADQQKNTQRPWIDLKTLRFPNITPQPSVEPNGDLADRFLELAGYNGSDTLKMFQKVLMIEMIRCGEVVLPIAPEGQRSVDEAIKIGLSHELGPFEIADLLAGANKALNG